MERGQYQTSGGVTELMSALRKPTIHGVTHLKSGCLSVSFVPSDGRWGCEYLPFDAPYFSEHLAQGVSRYGDGKSEVAAWVLQLALCSSEWGKSIVNLPLAAVLNCSRNYVGHYQVYSHAFLVDRERKQIPDSSRYIGVTKRGWLERWREHVRSAKNGSHYRFHEAIRQYSDALVFQHDIIGLYETEDGAMAMEEKMVGLESLYPLGLNMIPGGYAGMRFLHRIGAVAKGERISPDQKHEFVNRFFETASRKGLPNPFAAANWMDAEYAEKVICGGPDRLKPSQIREARYLETLGFGVEQISSEIGARNASQVKRLIDGITYSRVA